MKKRIISTCIFYEVPLIAYEDFRGTQDLEEPCIMYETEIILEDTIYETKILTGEKDE